MSSNTMTRLGKMSVLNRPGSIRPVNIARKTCDVRHPVALRCQSEDVVAPVVAKDVAVQETVSDESTTDLSSVTFSVVRHVEFGQTVKVVGGAEFLGNWQPEVAVPLNWTEGDVWTADMELPSGPFEYKYLVIDGDGTLLEWYPGENLLGDVTTDGISLENDWIVPIAEPQPEETPEMQEEGDPIKGELVEEAEVPLDVETPTTSEIKEEPEAAAEEEPEAEAESETVAETEVEAVIEPEAEVETEVEEKEIVAEAETEIEAVSVSEAADCEEEEEVEEVEEAQEEKAAEEEDVVVAEKVKDVTQETSEIELETSAAVESVLDKEVVDEPVVKEEQEGKKFQALSKGFGSPFFKRNKRGSNGNNNNNNSTKKN